MALEVFTGTSVTLPALRGDDQYSHSSALVDTTRLDAAGTFSIKNVDFSRQDASHTFTEVTLGGSGANIPKVGIIFPTGVPVFCA